MHHSIPSLDLSLTRTVPPWQDPGPQRSGYPPSVWLVLGFLVGLVAAAEAGTGPAGYWGFDEGSGTTVRDGSGNGLDGRISGTAAWAQGMVGGALRFDGASYVEVPFNSRLQLGAALTIQAWILPTDYTPNTYKRIAEMWDSYILRLDNPPEGGKLSFFTFLDGTPEPRLSSSVPELQRWHQVFAVWDGTNILLWLDDAKRIAPRTGNPAPQARPLRVGQNFIGLIDEVKIYDRALTEDEILTQVPPRLVSTLHVARPVCEIGRPFEVSCTLSNAGGQPLTNGVVGLSFPVGLRLVGGTRLVSVPLVTRHTPVVVRWPVQADTALCGHVEAMARFPGQFGATNVTGVVVADPIPNPSEQLSGPCLVQSGDLLVLGNRRVRLVFPRQAFGYGVWAVDVNQDGTWKRMGVANSMSSLAVKSGDRVLRQFIHADSWQAVSELPGQAGVEFQRTLDDGTGNPWTCRFTFRLGDDDRVRASYEATPQQDAALVLWRGPTLFVGEGSFGSEKNDALFCGLEWLVQDEVSSSNLDMHDPDYYVRFVPHPNKITIPLMAVAREGAALGLFWDSGQTWDGQHDRPAAVFASPNFIDGQSNHLLGLFLPSVPDWVKANELEAAATPYAAAANRALRLEAWLTAMSPATQSLACVTRWFDTFGVPEPAPVPRGDYVSQIEFSMRAFLESLWDATEQNWWTSKGGPAELTTKARPPHYAFQLRLAAALTSDPGLRDRCNVRAALAEQLGGFRPLWDDMGLTWANAVSGLAQWRSQATAAVDTMGADGAWRFRARIETNGIFAGRDYGLLGPDGAAEVGTCARLAYEILRYARVAGDLEAFTAAEKALQFMERFQVPRAAQVWECPVHSPDILAAADAVDAYLEAYRFSGKGHCLEEAVRWARAGLPFVYVWNPPGQPMLRHASIAIFGGSWYQGSWIGQPVQWNGLRYAHALLKLADHDASFAWREIAVGITVSALLQQDTNGPNVALWPDNFSALDWSKCPWVFEPGMIVKNLAKVIDHEIEPTTAVAGPGIRINARARLTEVSLQGRTLRFSAQFPAAETGQILVAGLNKPSEVRVNGAVVPVTTSNLWDVAGAAWRYDAGPAAVTLKLVTSGSHAVEVAGAEYWPVALVFPVLGTIEFGFETSPQGWTPAHQIERVRIADGLLQGTATGGDPYLHQTRLRVDGNSCRKIAVRARATAGNGLALYWVTEDNRTWGEDKVLRVPFSNRAQLVEYVFEVGNHPLWAGHTIVGLRIDPFEGGTGGDFAIDYIRGDQLRLRAGRFQGGAFQFFLDGLANARYRVETTSDFSAWTATFTIPTGTALRELWDTNTSQFGQRFYRALPEP